MLSRPRSGFDRNGDPVLFYKAGEFPSASDPEFELASEARHVYKSGELPLLLRVLGPINHKLGLPFSLTAFANAHGAQTLLLIIPMLTIVFPLMKLVPILYVEHSAPPALLVPPAQAARAQPRSRPRTRGDRRAARRN